MTEPAYDRHGGYDIVEAELYDFAYTTLMAKAARGPDIDFFVDYSRQAGGPTLELGCGTGRVLIPTAAAGCQITGLDRSKFMLDQCRKKLAREPEALQRRARLIQGDMTDFQTGETYSLVTIPFRPFQHLTTVDEQKACLGCVRRHLAPGGRLVFDVFNPRFDRLYNPKYTEEEIEDLPDVALPDGRHFRRASRISAFHRDQQCNDIELIYYVTHPDGHTERIVQAFPMRYYFRFELEHLLELCGLRVIDLFGNFDRSACGPDSPEMIFVATGKD